MTINDLVLAYSSDQFATTALTVAAAHAPRVPETEIATAFGRDNDRWSVAMATRSGIWRAEGRGNRLIRSDLTPWVDVRGRVARAVGHEQNTVTELRWQVSIDLPDLTIQADDRGSKALREFVRACDQQLDTEARATAAGTIEFAGGPADGESYVLEGRVPLPRILTSSAFGEPGPGRYVMAGRETGTRRYVWVVDGG